MQKAKRKSAICITTAFILAMICVLCSGRQTSLDGTYLDIVAIFIPHITFIALLIAWVLSVKKRIINSGIRNHLIAVGMLMIFWLSVRTCKWFFVSSYDDLCRYLWYAYYIPMVMIPLLGVFVTLYIGKPDSYKLPPWLKFLYIPAVMLITLVFTNDFHRQVFDFPEGILYFNDTYTYEIGFYFICAWFIFLGFYFVIMLVVKSRVPGSKTFQKLPLIIMGGAVVFWLLYSMKFIVADLVAVDCLMITLLLESSIQAGLIRSNAGYTEFFEISTVSAQVVDKNYSTRFISSYADDLPEDVMRNAEKKPLDLGKTMLHCKPVSGGYFFWQSDIKQIKKLMKKLEETKERLSESNYLLKAEIDIREQKARLDEKNRLYDRIASDVSSQLSKADKLLSQVQGDSSESKYNLSQICVLSAYIKRRSNLLLLGEESQLIPAGELEFCIRESLDNLRLLDVYTSLTGKADGTVNAEDVVAVYDIFESVIESLMSDMNAVMISLSCSHGHINMCMQIGCNEKRMFSLPENCLLNGGKVECNIDENDISVSVVLPWGGESND